MNICLIAQILAMLSNSHHDAKITPSEIVLARNWAITQCKVEVLKQQPKKK